ncbi:MAG: phosphoadenylyl-sulfate reductase [Saprospiraceae bacterium]|nr:phosphoadenylyl-sulfate reductase [Saprospiraceae bacterium]
MSENIINELNERFKNQAPEKVIEFFLGKYKKRIALSSSMGAEDQVLTHMMIGVDKKAKIFTLDTGRMFPETYDVIDKTCMKYGIEIQIYFPLNTDVEEMVNSKGINLFYESVENRQYCCNIRKVEPLNRAFHGLDAWICGLRHEQSVTRQEMQMIEWDEVHNLIKINPLINWTEEQVWEYIRKNNVPYNILHDKGFPSIGCRPCTRAVKKGEDIRTGRWWWEDPEHKECGLHK